MLKSTFRLSSVVALLRSFLAALGFTESDRYAYRK
jgi:hypothetical protein